MLNFLTKSPEETFSIGEKFAQLLKEGTVICLQGDLGAGKTLFVQGLAVGLGIAEEVTSPTFALLNIYQGSKTLYHFDLYRLDFSEELYDIGVNLRACDGFNYCYDVVNLKESLDNHAAVFVTDKSLALTVNNFMKALDWQEFKDTLKDININEYSGNKIESKYNDFVLECKSVELYNRLNSELKVFIEEVKREPPDKIVASAYEIVTKEEVVNYCQEKTPFLTLEQYSALMSEENILDNIYEQWCSNGELSGREDIEIVLCETADRIQISLDREEKEPTVQKIEPKLEPVMQQNQENVIKPKYKSR